MSFKAQSDLQSWMWHVGFGYSGLETWGYRNFLWVTDSCLSNSNCKQWIKSVIIRAIRIGRIGQMSLFLVLVISSPQPTLVIFHLCNEKTTSVNTVYSRHSRILLLNFLTIMLICLNQVVFWPRLKWGGKEIYKGKANGKFSLSYIVKVKHKWKIKMTFFCNILSSDTLSNQIVSSLKTKILLFCI